MSTIDQIKSWPWVSTTAALGGAAILAQRIVETPALGAALFSVGFAAPVLSVGAGVAGLRNAFNKERSGLSRVFSAVAGVAGVAPVVAMPVLMNAAHGMGLGLVMLGSIPAMTVAGSLNVTAHAIEMMRKPASPAGKAWWVAPAAAAIVLGCASYAAQQANESLTRRAVQIRMIDAAYHAPENTIIAVEADKVIVTATDTPDTKSRITFDFGRKAEVCATYYKGNTVSSHDCAALSGYSAEDMEQVRYAVCTAARTQNNAEFLTRRCPGF